MLLFLLAASYLMGWLALSMGQLHPDSFTPKQILSTSLQITRKKLWTSGSFPCSILVLVFTYDFPTPVYALILLTFYTLLRLSLTDIRYFLVPLHPLVFWMLSIGCLQNIFLSFQWIQAGLRFLLVYLIGCILYRLFQRTFGLGDVYFLSALAFISNLPFVFLVLKLAILLAGGFAILAIILRKIERKDALPFIPFLSFSLYICIYWKPWLFLIG